MELTIIPFAHDYYIINLPPYDSKAITQDHRETLFEILRYKNLNFRKENIKFAPVIRLFGSHNGMGACVHVHGYFPYFYIKVEEMKHLFEDDQFIVGFIEHIHTAYLTTYFQNADDRMRSQFQLIYNYEIVKKRDFYGTHFLDEMFLKLFLYDRQYMSKLVSLLHSGALMDYQFQSYESHIPYFMHFYADCNIFGMTPVTVQQGIFRKRFPPQIEQILDNDGRVTLMLDAYSKHIKFSPLSKLSFCPFEIDCHYSQLINQEWSDEYEFLQVINFVKEIEQKLSSQKKSQNLRQEFHVEFTLTLNRLWRDEQDRRKRLNLAKPTLVMDMHNNREGQGQMNSFPSVNILEGKEVQQKLREHIQKYKNSLIDQKPMSYDKSFINYESVQRFFSGQEAEKIQSGKSIDQRFKAYVTRKKDLLDMIKTTGNFDYEYHQNEDNEDSSEEQIELDHDEEQDLKDIVTTSQDMLKAPNIFDTIRHNQKLRDDNKNRKKYTVNKNLTKTKKFQVFQLCQYCNKTYFQCACFTKDFATSFQRPSNVIQKQTHFESLSYIYKLKPPTPNEVQKSLFDQDATFIPQYVYYSNSVDLYKHYKVNHQRVDSRQSFIQHLDQEVLRTASNKFYRLSIENNQRLPSNYYVEMQAYRQISKQSKQIKPQTYLYQFDAPTREQVDKSLVLITKQLGIEVPIGIQIPLNSQLNFTQEPAEVKIEILIDKRLELSLFCMEVFSSCTEQRLPDPTKDEINIVAITLHSFGLGKIIFQGLIVSSEIQYQENLNDPSVMRLHYGVPDDTDLLIVKSEIDLLRLMTLVVILMDPDLVGGWDLERGSLYYLVERAKLYDMDMLTDMSRSQDGYEYLLYPLQFDEFIYDCSVGSVLKSRLDHFMQVKLIWYQVVLESSNNPNPQSKRKSYRPGHATLNKAIQKRRNNLYLVGRVLLNVWRQAQSDLKLADYSLENVAFSVLQQKIPRFENHTLTRWLQGDVTHLRTRTVRYILSRCLLACEVAVKMDLVPRWSEIAKLYGCEFEAVGSRGSQFKIESVMCRVTKQHNFVLLSATRQQVCQQKILECIPLVIEPPKMLIVDPVVVLDFQSLYPSIMIAYNLCFSTCLGNINEIFRNGKKRFGVKHTNIDFQYLMDTHSDEELMEHILVTPNNVAFLKSSVREGIVPKILSEFLQTRIMIKKSAALYRGNEEIQKLCSFRQLALKLFMNVMYGYCGASFSGRMPSGDVADSVVEIGRTILNQCILNINSNKTWGAEVLYGDTDSLFVVLRGRSNEEAFKIGSEMAREITTLYPYPIDLKFEKVYNPMFLVAKKRYVGYKMERFGDRPVFEGKGLEMIRRDGCPAVVKIMRKAIRLVFDTRDLTLLKHYMHKQWAKLLNGHFTLNDFVIAKEVKLGKYSGTLPPHAVVATKMIERDPMTRPNYAERIKYLVVQGVDDKAKVSDLVVSMNEYMSNPNYRLNAHYYINKQINSSLGRLFTTFDVNINEWFADLPKGLARRNQARQSIQQKSNLFTLHHYYHTTTCALCQATSNQEICEDCLKNGSVTLILINQKQNFNQAQLQLLESVCRTCAQLPTQIEEVPCFEFNCHLVSTKKETRRNIHKFQQQLTKYLEAADIIEEF